MDEVLPDVPLRQWVLSFPYPVRFALAFDPALASAVRRLFVRALFDFLRERAARHGVQRGAPGAVLLAQRFGSALNLNLHFHALVLDGVYTQGPNPLAPPIFHPAPPLADQDVAELAVLIRRRVLRHLRRVGRMREPCAVDEAPRPDEPLFAQLCARSVEGRGAQPLRPDPASARSRGRRRTDRPLFIPGELCADVDGFSLHAKVAIRAGDPDGRERLCRYIARPALCAERLSIQDDGRIVWRLRRRWRDGTGALVFEPLDFIARLAALVPRPRAHLLTYHGVLAPAAQWRDLIVPGPRTASPSLGAAQPTAPGDDVVPRTAGQHACAAAHLPTRPSAQPARACWAELLRRAFAIDVLTCPRCGGARALIAMITQRSVIERILGHLGLPSAPPRLASARAPPELEFAG